MATAVRRGGRHGGAGGVLAERSRKDITAAALLCGIALASLLFPPAPFAAENRPGGPEAGPVSFLVLGDWGSRSACQAKVAEQMGIYGEAARIDFVITTGDNFYRDGVSSVDDEKWGFIFERVFQAPSLQVPWYAVLGNHDYRGSVEAQVAYSSRQGRWKMPGRRYFFEKGLGDGVSALFVFLDTSPFVLAYRMQPWRYPDLERQGAAGQLRWLEEILAASRAEWKIVVGHHTVFSGGDMHGPTRELREALPPLFERHDVRAYFSGHDHNLQHLSPPGPTHYIVSGGGSDPRGTGRGESTLFASGACGFVAARLGTQEMRLEFIGEEGNVLYRALIPRRSEIP